MTGQVTIRAIITTANPHSLIEANFSDPFNSLIIRIYNMTFDHNTYLSLSGLDANGRYIVTQVLDIENMMPYFRIYDREET